MLIFGRSLNYILRFLLGFKEFMYLVYRQLREFGLNILKFMSDKDLDSFLGYFLSEEQKEKLRKQRIKEKKRQRRLQNLRRTLKVFKKKKLYKKTIAKTKAKNLLSLRS